VIELTAGKALIKDDAEGNADDAETTERHFCLGLNDITAQSRFFKKKELQFRSFGVIGVSLGVIPNQGFSAVQRASNFEHE
jgi:hypothetical protein